VTDPILTADGIAAGYGAGLIVREVSVRVEKGQIVTILGPNGAGKSTLLKAIVGVVPRAAGLVRIDGVDVSRLRVDQLNRIGLAYVPQLHNVFTTLTVRENLEIGGYSMRSGVQERIEEILIIFPQLRKALGRAAGTLSGGERSLLALARGLMTRPKLLLIDEPTAGLSPQSERIVWEHLTLIRESGVATLVVEQNVRQALESCDMAYVLVQGQIRLHGPAAELAATESLASLYIGGGPPTDSRTAGPLPGAEATG
jgi:ABC-type branched-subunit amino acid transport system ATPase component